MTPIPCVPLTKGVVIRHMIGQPSGAPFVRVMRKGTAGAYGPIFMWRPCMRLRPGMWP